MELKWRGASSYSHEQPVMPFTEWLVECAVIGASDPRVPDEYTWSVEEPGDWWYYWNASFTPQAAAEIMIPRIAGARLN